MKLPRYLVEWLFSDKPALAAVSALDEFEREIQARLDARKALRPQRSAAAFKGARTKRAKFQQGETAHER